MNQNDYIIEYEGFDPSSEVKTSLKILAEKLMSEAPSDSFLKITVTGGANLMKGLIRIASQAGTFIAEASELTPTERSAVRLIDKLSSRVCEQLHVWKKKRFLNHRPSKFSPFSLAT